MIKIYSLKTMYYATAGGVVVLTISPEGLVAAEFADAHAVPHDAVFLAQTKIPEPVLVGTPFQCLVWRATMDVAAGQTVTYQELAKNIGKPTAWRAVARALSQNKITYVIPCHRVVQKNGGLGGYKWGVVRKRALLESEKSILE